MTTVEKTKYRTSRKWKDFRLRMLIAADFTCEVCSIMKKGKQSRNLHIHHINPDAYGDETDQDIAVLCSSCHKEIERLLKRKVFDIEDYVFKKKMIFIASKLFTSI